MTQVRVRLTRPGPDGINRPVSGVTAWQPSRRLVDGDDVLLPGPPMYVDHRPPAVPVIELDPVEPTDGWAWQVTEYVQARATTRYVLVPDSDEVVEYADLVEVDPKTLAPTSQPTAAWVAALAGYVKKGPLLTQQEFDELPDKDPNTFYPIVAAQ